MTPFVRIRALWVVVFVGAALTGGAAVSCGQPGAAPEADATPERDNTLCAAGEVCSDGGRACSSDANCPAGSTCEAIGRGELTDRVCVPRPGTLPDAGVDATAAASDSGSDAPSAPSLPRTAVETGIGLEDMDVSHDGSVIVVAGSKVRCYEPGLVPAAAGVKSWSTSYSMAGFNGVSRSRVTKQSTILSRVFLTPGDFASRRYVVHFVSPDCSAVTAGGVLDGPREYADLEVDDAGRTVVVAHEPIGGGMTRAVLRFFDAAGSLVKTLPWPESSCGSNGVHLALNRATGNGVFTCQGHYYDPILFRRFDAAGNWTDAASTIVDGTAGSAGAGGSSYYDSHIVGMDDQGRFAVLWARNLAMSGAGPTTREIALYDASAKLISHVTIDSYAGQVFDEFREQTAKVQRVGQDLLFPWTHINDAGGPSFDSITRLAPTGAATSTKDIAASLKHLVIDSAKNNYTYNGSTNQLVANEFVTP